MAEIMLSDGTPITVEKSVGQPARFHSWQDGVRYRVAFAGEFIGIVESWRDTTSRKAGRLRVGRDFHPKHWRDTFSVGVLWRVGEDGHDAGAHSYNSTRKVALERLVTRYCEVVKKRKTQ